MSHFKTYRSIHTFIGFIVLLVSLNLSAQSTSCPVGFKWDEQMKMCMPIGGAVNCPVDFHWSIEDDQCVPNNCQTTEVWDTHTQKCMPKNQIPNACPASTHWDSTMGMCMPNSPAPTGQCAEPNTHWDDAMGMCMPDLTGKSNLNFHINQYMIGITESGPRGRTAFSAPNMFNLTFQQIISKCDSVKIDWMGTTDKWTTPKDGTPELLQTGEANKEGKPYLDAQHPHTSPIMGLTFSVIHCLSKDNDNKITLSFAPRGEATAGPQAFMHRPSAEGSPNAPLGHHLQDVFHIMSTVLAAKLEVGKWTISGSLFSGQEPSPAEVTLDMHKFDSGGLSVSRKLSDKFTVGVSVANVLETHRAPIGQIPESPARNTILNAWLYTNHKFKSSTLNTAVIFGQSNEEGRQLNSFLSELSYKFGTLEKNHVFSRFEVLQRTPEELEVTVIGDAKNPVWVKALTLGYERNIVNKKGLSIFAGGSATRSFIPSSFVTTYGKNPLSAEIHLRIRFTKNKSWGKK